jgi:MinD-like ATPase involved in chromosome partitioning or flagellar assembly
MIHFDEARHSCIESLQNLCDSEAAIERAVLIEDVFGKIRAIVWLSRDASEELRNRIAAELSESGKEFWAGDLWVPDGETASDNTVYEAAWEQGNEVTSKLRRAERYRSKGFWLNPPTEPAWQFPVPPVIAFYSFKGGVGRTTALASFAIQRARAGERVVVLDLDIEAPGIGTLLDAGEGISGASWGVLDYLLERPLLSAIPDFRDYYHACARPGVTGSGEILVIPAGSLNSDFLAKLSRVDFQPGVLSEKHPLLLLLEQVRDHLRPQWILLDCRAGISEAAGFVLGGLPHLAVLFGTTSEQSWLGLRMILERLGAERVRRDRPQLECLVVHAMVPDEPTTRARAESDFVSRSLDEFTDHYYKKNPSPLEEDDDYWYVQDIEAEFAPHIPVVLPYKSKLAFIKRIDDVADDLAVDSDYRGLGDRIMSRFAALNGEEGSEP